MKIHQGDALSILRGMRAGSIQTCVTSPPYYGLRDYKTGKWEGGRPGCDHTIRFKSRATRPLGRLHGGHATIDAASGIVRDTCPRCGARRVDLQVGLERTPEAYVARLVAIFREVRRVLKDEGTLWLNLGDSYKSRPGQRTVHDKSGYKQATNRGSEQAPSRAVATLKPKDLIGVPWRVAFALQADGWYLRSDIIWHKRNPMPESVRDRPTKAHEYLFLLSKSPRYYYDADAIAESTIDREYRERGKVRPDSSKWAAPCPNGPQRVYANLHRQVGGRLTRNRRTVWTLVSESYKGAHFATFPQRLVEPCILAGAPEGGTVLDPFAGSGTTLLVAERLGRRGVGIELNPDYIRLAEERLAA